MNKRLYLAFLVLLLTGLVVAIGFRFYRSEQEYQGKRLSLWLEQIGSWPGWSPAETGISEPEVAAQKERVTVALLAMGTNSLPHLVRMVAAEERVSPLRRLVAWLNEHQSWAKIPIPQSPPMRAYAGEAFRLLGTNAVPAIPELTQLLQNEATSSIAADCLLSIGPSAMDSFVRALTNQSDRVQSRALSCLGDFGPAAQGAVPLILKIARGTNTALARDSLRILSEVHPNPAELLPLFESRVTDPESTLDAAFALARCGPAGLPILLRALTNEERHVRIGALGALQPEINEDKHSKIFSPADSGFSRLNCKFNLSVMNAAWRQHQNQEQPAVISALTRLAGNSNAAVQMLVIERLRGLGIAAAPGLSIASASVDSTVQKAAEEALKGFGVTTQGGAIIRANLAVKRIGFAFSGHSFAEGGETILAELAKHKAQASFFLTGDFLADTNFTLLIRRVLADGHYLGPHSDKHRLYCEWDRIKKTLVTRDEFRTDLEANLQRIERFGRSRAEVGFFLPPFEQYNHDIAVWSAELGLTLINFTPGTRSNADYTGEADKNFVSSQASFGSIVKREREDPHGLNGFILLLHLGSGPGRADKFHARFGELLDYLGGKGYQFVRVDELLEPKGTP